MKGTGIVQIIIGVVIFAACVALTLFIGNLEKETPNDDSDADIIESES